MSRAHRLGLLTFAVVPLLAACGFEEPAIPVVTREALTRVHVPPIEGRTGVMDAMVVDPETHLLYVADGTSPDHPGVDVVDIGASPAAYRATIATGDAPPNGLALVPERHRLYAGGDDGSVSIIDLTPGSPRFQTVVATLTIAWDFGQGRQLGTFDLAGAGDLLTYDPASDHFYFAASNYAPAEMAIFGGSPIRYLTAVPTSHKSHTVAYDPVHRMIYTPDGIVHEAGLYAFPDPVRN